jgi:hypothetical protein
MEPEGSPATAALRLVGSCQGIDERRVTAMAETKRMTTEEVVGYLLEGEGLDFLRESLCWVVQQLMEAEVSELVGAAPLPGPALTGSWLGAPGSPGGA